MTSTVDARSADATADERARVRAARTAIALVFASAGLAFASLASRFPAVRSELSLTPADLGTTLLAMSLGAVAALPLSSPLVQRFGPGRTVALGFASLVSGLAVIGAGDTRAVLALGFVCMGIGSGVSDVAMNVEAADVERRIGRDIMSRFHAAFSVGTVAGAAIGAAMAELEVGYRLHLLAVAAVVGAMVTCCVPRFLHGFRGRADEHADPAASAPGTGADPALAAPAPRRRRGQLAAWTERRTLLLGVLVLGMAFAEGSANDWISLALVDDYDAGHALAALGFGVFVTAMTVGRMSGPWLLARFGRVSAVRGGALLVLAGSSLLAWGGSLAGPGTGAALAVAFAGALLWGCGAALGFPVGMSAAADEPHAAAARVGVVSTIGYTAFIAGPPLLGHLGNSIGVAHALVGVSVAVLLSLVAAPAAAAPPVPAGGASGGPGVREVATVKR
ncbi:MAG: MFS transporter [Kineosporiaceae bacterium]